MVEIQKLSLNTAHSFAKILLALELITQDDFNYTVETLMNGNIVLKDSKMKKAKKPKKGGKKK